MNYLQKAIELSRNSFEVGEFPAGAVLVMPSGTMYESDPSVSWNHAECSVLDEAISSEAAPLKGAIVYASMEPCLMCYAKMYWAGVTKVSFVIPKSKTNTQYAYEDNLPMHEHIKAFNTPIQVEHNNALLDEALKYYEEWIQGIESK
jgi:tRNA(Arg) A34 adenosine deaminase TadA